MIEIKNTVTEMKIAFDGLIRRPDRAKEGISILEDMWIKTSTTNANSKGNETRKRIAKKCGPVTQDEEQTQ